MDLIQRLSIGNGDNFLVRIRLGDRVGGGDCADTASEGFYRLDTVFDYTLGNERSCAVVDKYDFACDRLQSVLHGFRSGATALYELYFRKRGANFFDFRLVAQRIGDNDFVDTREIEGAKGFRQDLFALYDLEKFIICKFCARALSRGANDNGNTHDITL